MFTGKGMLHRFWAGTEGLKNSCRRRWGGAGEWGRALSSKYKQRPRGLKEYSPSTDNPVLSGELGASESPT